MPLDRNNTIKHVGILGIGGVGGFFGGKIAFQLAREAFSKTWVYFVARGAHLEKIRQAGLVLNTAEGRRLVCKPTLATDHVEDLPALDLCLICVKSYDLEEIVKALNPKVGPETLIIPLLNGVDVYERIRKILNNGILLPATVYVGTHIEEPGVVTQVGGEGVILCGRDPSFPGFNPEELIDFFARMDIKFKWQEDPRPAIWEKYVFIAPFGLVTACSGKTLGEVMADDESRKLVGAVMREVVRIAEKNRIRLPPGIVSGSLEKAGKFPHETRTSYQRDVETEGKDNEGDLFGGTIIRLGEELGVPTPATRSLYGEIRKRSNR